LPFKLYTKKNTDIKGLEKGQNWCGESIGENLSFCEFEGCSTVFEKHLSQEGLILDAGCGLGRWVLFFKKRDFKIVGCDINHSALKEARRYDPDLWLVTADIRYLPFKEGIFDSIISLGVIEHLEEGPEKAIKEKRRALKPKGNMFLAVPYNNLFRQVFVNRVISLKTSILRAFGNRMVFTEYRYSKLELTFLLQSSGFEIQSFYPEMLAPPKHIGSSLDYMHITGILVKQKFEVPWMVRIAALAAKSISPWLISGMVLCVVKKKFFSSFK
jgi:SAM-dependent methyltransferase